MRIAVEATSLVQDRRGIGRYARHLIQSLALLDPTIQFTFFVKQEMIATTRGEVARLGLGTAQAEVDSVFRIAGSDYDLFGCPWSYTRHWPARGPVAVTLHDVTPLCFPDQLPAALIPRLKRRYRLRRSGRRADLILTDSEFSRREIMRVLGTSPDRIRVALLGTEAFAPGDRAAAAAVARTVGATEPYLLYVGGHEERKNLTRLIEAFELVRSRHRTECELVLAGPAALPAALATRIAASGWAEAIHPLVSVDDPTLQALYRGAEALIYPSIYEGFGLPVLEAMASGTPVVASSAPPLPEVGGEAVIYFDPFDVGAMARQMSRVVTDRGLNARLGRLGVARAALFRWEDTARITLKAFTEVVNHYREGIAWNRRPRPGSALEAKWG
jgi:alpha-1,3-rhamnosyl/mannosyltransferase